MSDGWGGSMVATEMSDILFGTPSPVAIEVNMGVLKENQVNIIIHGHEPNLFESMVVSVNSPVLIQAAKDAGAEGLQPGGHVLFRSGNDGPARNPPCRKLHVHRGDPDAPVPWMPWAWMFSASSRDLPKSRTVTGTGLFTTNPQCHIQGATHIEFNEHDPLKTY